MRARVCWGLVAVGAVLAVAVPLVAGLRWSEYSPRARLISELGAREAPDGGLVSLAFGLVGLLLAAGGVVLARTLLEPRSVVWAAAVVALALGGSYLVSAVSPCDPGCPGGIAAEPDDGAGVGDAGDDDRPGTVVVSRDREEEVTTGQQVHNVAAAVGYLVALAGVVAFAYAARGSDGAVASLGVAAVVVVAGLAVTSVEGWAGAFQRIGEVALLGWLVEVFRRLTAPPPVSDVVRPTGPTAVLGDFAATREPPTRRELA